MEFIYNDGGRKEAGYKGTAGDCFVRAVCIITGKSYKEVYDEVNLISKTERITRRQKTKSSSRNGIHIRTARRYLKKLGFKWIPTMLIGSGCKVHLKKDELPNNPIIARVSRHFTTVINGIIYDTYDPSRNETRCVYGYWIKGESYEK